MYNGTTVQKVKRRLGKFPLPSFFMWVPVNRFLLVLLVDMPCQHHSRPAPPPTHKGKKRKMSNNLILLSCDSGGIQTHNLLIRSQMLYSVELRSLRAFCFVLRVQSYYIFLKLQNFFDVFFIFL